jgi:hypothetical protein
VPLGVLGVGIVVLKKNGENRKKYEFFLNEK